MFHEFKDTILFLNKNDIVFAKKIHLHGILDKTIKKLESYQEEVSELKKIKLELKDDILECIKKFHTENNTTSHEKSLAMEGTCMDWDNIEQDDFAN